MGIMIELVKIIFNEKLFIFFKKNFCVFNPIKFFRVDHDIPILSNKNKFLINTYNKNYYCILNKEF